MCVVLSTAVFVREERCTGSARRLLAASGRRRGYAEGASDADWPQILVLYGMLERISPSPMLTLDHAVAVAMVRGPQAGLDLLKTLDDDTASPSITARCRYSPRCEGSGYPPEVVRISDVARPTAKDNEVVLNAVGKN